MKEKVFEVKCPVFKTSLWFVVNCDYKRFNKICKKRFELNKDDNFEWLSGADGTAIILSDKSSTHRIVWLETFKMNNERIGVLVHEITHAVIRMLEWKGIPFTSTDNQDETFAYLMDYFVSNFIYRYKE